MTILQKPANPKYWFKHLFLELCWWDENSILMRRGGIFLPLPQERKLQNGSERWRGRQHSSKNLRYIITKHCCCCCCFCCCSEVVSSFETTLGTYTGKTTLNIWSFITKHWCCYCCCTEVSSFETTWGTTFTLNVLIEK
jgi:hypothetical protein